MSRRSRGFTSTCRRVGGTKAFGGASNTICDADASAECPFGPNWAMECIFKEAKTPGFWRILSEYDRGSIFHTSLATNWSWILKRPAELQNRDHWATESYRHLCEKLL